LTKPLTKNQYQAVAKAVAFSSRLEESELLPKDELTLRWNAWIAAAFLAALIAHAKTPARDEGEPESKIVDFFLDTAIGRGREIGAQGHA
jgi:hypothetical protein